MHPCNAGKASMQTFSLFIVPQRWCIHYNKHATSSKKNFRVALCSVVLCAPSVHLHVALQRVSQTHCIHSTPHLLSTPKEEVADSLTACPTTESRCRAMPGPYCYHYRSPDSQVQCTRHEGTGLHIMQNKLSPVLYSELTVPSSHFA